jgi:ankyrin repeat protein
VLVGELPWIIGFAKLTNSMFGDKVNTMVDAKQFSQAVWDGNLGTVKAMIAEGADVNVADDPHQPPLHLAIEQQWIEIVRCLIDAGAEINQSLEGGWTPLVHAIDIESDAAWQANHETGHESTELTELLLAAGAEPTKQAFEIARRYDNRKATALLEGYRRPDEPGAVADRPRE